MRDFFDANQLWPGNESRIHVYLVPTPDDSDLWRLIRQARQAISDSDIHCLHPAIADDWLHVTVSSTPAGAAPDRCIRAMTNAVSVSGIAPFTLRMGSALVTERAVILDGDDDIDGQFTRLKDVTTRAFRAANGASRPDAGPPHIALAYGRGIGDSGEITSSLWRSCRPPHAPMTVTRIDLVDVTQHPSTGDYRWTTLAQIPLTDTNHQTRQAGKRTTCS